MASFEDNVIALVEAAEVARRKIAKLEERFPQLKKEI